MDDSTLSTTHGRSIQGQAAAVERPAAPTASPPRNPTTLDKPAFLMNFPFSLATGAANNIWMRELAADERRVDRRAAYRQFLEVYGYLASDALVYLLPTPRQCDLQDLVFTGNLGIVLDHLPDKNTVIVSNFESAPRVGEREVGLSFFRSMGYDVHVPPASFEGEADLKHLHDNVYVGGYGMRTDIETFEWMERTFDMKIIKVQKVDEYLYHLDCSVFPLTTEDTLVCTEVYEREELAELEAHTNVIDVSAEDCCSGICNSVRLYNAILNSSHVHSLKAGSEDYAMEIAKNRRLEDIAVNLGFEIAYFDLSEYHKSGALLSCMVMHLNRDSYRFTLV